MPAKVRSEVLLEMAERLIDASGGRLFIEQVLWSEMKGRNLKAETKDLHHLERSSGIIDAHPPILDHLYFSPIGNAPDLFRSWSASRLALTRAWHAARPEGERIGISLSHTEGAAAAAVRCVDGGAGAARVGIDLERVDRAISERAVKRIAHPEDQLEGLSPIAVWTAKEALLKASLQPNPSLSEGCIRWNRSEDVGEGVFRGEVFRIGLAQAEQLVIACAVFAESR